MEALIVALIAYAKANPAEVTLAVTFIGSQIVELTPTKKDDRVWKKYGKAVGNFIGLNWFTAYKILRGKA